jgi:hypothetical protein
MHLKIKRDKDQGQWCTSSIFIPEKIINSKSFQSIKCRENPVHQGITSPVSVLAISKWREGVLINC